MTPNQDALNALLDYMIPADETRGLPAGSQAQIERVLPSQVSMESLIDLASKLNDLVNQQSVHLSALGADWFWQLVQSHRQDVDPILQEIGKWLLMAYYTDPRVRDAIGVGARAPFPVGYVVHEGNLDLLEPVFARGPIYRNVDYV
jgi:hypothetical protein